MSEAKRWDYLIQQGLRQLIHHFFVIVPIQEASDLFVSINIRQTLSVTLQVTTEGSDRFSGRAVFVDLVRHYIE